MPLLDLFWTFLMFFLFFVWLMLLFRIFGDIFRSEDIGGGGKALWTIFVIFLPFLGVLFYVIAGLMLSYAQRATLRPRDLVEFGALGFALLVFLAITS